jgi:hypothetical protein
VLGILEPSILLINSPMIAYKNALEKSILKKTDGMRFLWGWDINFLADRKVCISYLSLMKATWLQCIRSERKGCSRLARIFVIILSIIDRTLIRRKLDTVWVSFFLGIMVMYA